MGSNLVFSYSTTETSTISSAPARALYEGAAGYVAPGVSVRVVDEGSLPWCERQSVLIDT
jgi:hypothetical protein